MAGVINSRKGNNIVHVALCHFNEQMKGTAKQYILYTSLFT